MRRLFRRLSPLWDSGAGRALRLALRVGALVTCFVALLASYGFVYLYSPPARGPIPAAVVIAVAIATTVVFVRARRTAFLPCALTATAALAIAGTWLMAQSLGASLRRIHYDARDEWYSRYAVLEGAIPAHPWPVHSVVISPNGGTLATLSEDGTLRLWSLADRSYLGDIVMGPPRPRWAAFTQSGDRLVVDRDRGVCLFSVPGQVLLGTLRHECRPEAAWYHSWTLGPDGGTIALTCRSQLCVWSTRDRELLGACTVDDSCSVSHSRFTPDGRFLVTGVLPTLVLSIPDLKLIRRFAEAALPDWHNAGRRFDGQFLAVLRDPDTGQPGLTVVSLPDGKPVAFFGTDSTVGGIVGFSPDGKILVARLHGAEGDLEILSIPDARPVGVIRGTRDITLLAFSPDSRWVVVRDYNPDRLFMVSTRDARVGGRLDTPDGGHLVRTFTPDSRIVVTMGDDSRVHLWSVPDCRLLATIGVRLPVTCAALTPDGSRIVTGHGDGTVRIWTVPQAGDR